MPYHINWNTHYRCEPCKTNQVKTKGIKCLKCGKRMKMKPRKLDPEVRELLVVRY